MDSSHRASTDAAFDRLAALRAGSSGSVSSGRRAVVSKGTVSAGLAAVVVILGVMITRLAGPDRSQPPTVERAPVATSSDGDLDLLAGEALMAFPVKQGNFPPDVNTGDLVRLVVTPGPDGVGEIKFIEEPVVVSEITAMSEISGDMVFTIRGREEILEVIAGSGPIHVARVHNSRVVE